MAAMNPVLGPDPSEVSCISNCYHPSPLTTTFTPPTSCSDYWTPVVTIGSISLDISFTQNSTRVECVPSHVASCSPCLSALLSPGICPNGWPAASTGIANDVTTHYCCPTDAGVYTTDFATSSISRCVGTFTNSFKKYIYNCTYNYTTTIYSSSIIAGSTVTSTISRNASNVTETSETIFVYTGTVAANPIIVQFKDDEIPSSTTLASTSGTNSSMPLPSQASTMGPTSTGASSPSSKQGSLSSGAKAGIGVGAALGICATAALGFFIYRLRKRETTNNGSTSALERPELSDKPMEAQELSIDASKARELPASSRQELNAHRAVGESQDQS